MAKLNPALSSWQDELRRSRDVLDTREGAATPASAALSRRAFIRRSFWTGIGVTLGGALASAVGFLYPRNVSGFGGPVAAGHTEDYPSGGDPQNVGAGFFWMVNLDPADERAGGGEGLLALWQRCPHLGCAIPWLPRFNFEGRSGWFRCPCHRSTYTRAGVRVFGPAPRSMDTMLVEVDANGLITVQTGEIARGGPDNPTRALPV